MYLGFIIKNETAMPAPAHFITWTWKHPLVFFWIVFPPLAINELLLGQRIPKVMLIGQDKKKPLHGRSFVPCPHCHTQHSSLKWSMQNKTALGNWFGLYCDHCGGIIPCVMNVTGFLLLAITFPLWVWFQRPLKRKWLRWQKQRFSRPLNLETPGYNWPVQGMGWGLFMFVSMGLFYPWVTGEVITLQRLLIAFLFWLAGGLIYGYVMKLFLGAASRKQDRLHAQP